MPFLEITQSKFNIIEFTTMLKMSGAVEFGSRALGVHTDNSDYDFALLATTYNNLFPNDALVHYDISEYFKVIPSKGPNTLVQHQYSTFLKDYNIDILTITHAADIDIIREAVMELKALPRELLENNQQRIKLYERALLRNGFKHSYIVRMHKYLNNIPKGFIWTLKNSKNLFRQYVYPWITP